MYKVLFVSHIVVVACHATSKVIESKFFLIFSVYISRTERGFPTKVYTLSYHTQKHKSGALRPWTSKWNAFKHRDSHSVGHVESAIFHCNIAMQQGHVENCGSLHPYFHQEQKKFWQLVPSGDNLCWKI